MKRFSFRVNTLNVIKFIAFETFVIYIFLKNPKPDEMTVENILPVVIFLLLGVIIGFYRNG